MMITDDERLEALRQGGCADGIPDPDVPEILDCADIIDSAAAEEDIMYSDMRVFRIFSGDRCRYYASIGGIFWISFEWCVHDAVNARLIRFSQDPDWRS